MRYFAVSTMKFITVLIGSTLYCIIFSILSVNGVSDEEVEEYANYLQQAMKEAQNGHLRKDNSEYRPETDEEPLDFGEYDFIIVGAGSSGTILANRLSEVKQWNILLLEAGDYPSNFTNTPFTVDISRLTKYNWGYVSVPQTHSCLGMNNRQCIIPRGRGIGGTTLINGLMYVRGYPVDFDRWEGLGNPGWGYKDVLPLFKKTEGMVKNVPYPVVDWNFHGKTGPLHTEFFPTTDVQMNAFFASLKKMGLKFTDVNSFDQVGFAPKPVQIKNGRRFDDGTAFVLPVLNRDNLKVMTNSFALKINVNSGKVADGVTFSHNKKLYKATATKEVIVSGGSINTPQLLMLSGIGPKQHLENHGIKVITDLKVGNILREHPMYFGLVFSSNYTEPIKSFEENVRDFLNGRGAFTIPGGVRAMGFIKSKMEKIPKYPDVEFMYIAGNCSNPAAKKLLNWNDDTWNSVFKDLNPAQCFSLSPIVLDPESVGYVKLKSNDPYEFPLINPNHLADKKRHDIRLMYEGIKFLLKAVDSGPLKKVNAQFKQKPLPACSHHKFLSDDYWYCSIEQLTYNVYHPVGSCPMGPNPKKGYVVNHELKVYGVEKLRVADASVFPFTLRGHPNAPCVMIGEKLAVMLKKHYL